MLIPIQSRQTESKDLNHKVKLSVESMERIVDDVNLSMRKNENRVKHIDSLV